jgi:hypothetical protein
LDLRQLQALLLDQQCCIGSRLSSLFLSLQGNEEQLARMFQ